MALDACMSNAKEREVIVVRADHSHPNHARSGVAVAEVSYEGECQAIRVERDTCMWPANLRGQKYRLEA